MLFTMKPLEETIELSGACFYTMLRSVIEPLDSKKPKESAGDLLGRKNQYEYFCINAYPWLNAQGKTGSITYDMDEKADRIRRFNRAVNKKGGLGTYVIGGYHSHYYHPTEIANHGLSNTDIYEGILPEMKKLNRPYWIEITLSIKEREYRNAKKTGETIKELKKKLLVIVTDTPNHEYRITISGYKVTDSKKPKIRELKVKKRKVKVTKLKEK